MFSVFYDPKRLRGYIDDQPKAQVKLKMIGSLCLLVDHQHKFVNSLLLFLHSLILCIVCRIVWHQTILSNHHILVFE